MVSAWGYHTQLTQRLSRLPLLLAGPILRRTETHAVTVWVALKAPSSVTLTVYATQDQGATIHTPLLEGTGSTVPLGQYLHVVAVTATPVSSTPLQPGELYAYDLHCGDSQLHLTQILQGSADRPSLSLSYFTHQLPTFALPPADLKDLVLVHGSCRKLSGGGPDALNYVDDLIQYYAQQPNARPHQLFFTGDQIYGDDVADPLLWVGTAVGDVLLGWDENLPLYAISPTAFAYRKPSDLKPGERSEIADKYAGFTAMHINSPEKAKSHLFSLGEYYAAYLLAWSPVLWPESLPKGAEIHAQTKLAHQWDEEVSLLRNSIEVLPKVRRVIANVPTYMICDDHDITDDWYLNRAWCEQVLGKPLGRRVVQNALLAYALFQAWGNTPAQFEPGQSGEALLQAAARWSASGGTDGEASQQMAKYLGLPPISSETGLPQLKLDHDVWILDRDYPDQTIPLEWHYTLRSLNHEVIVLDTRTWRGYPVDEPEAIAPPRLLSPTAFVKQIQYPLDLTDRLNQRGEVDINVTFLILPTNLVSLRIIDQVQKWELEQGKVFNSDVGDAWNLNEVALFKLLTELFQRRRVVIILSGDIHYSGTLRLNYQAKSQTPGTDHSPNLPKRGIIAQLTASPFRNSEFKTHLIHTKVKSLLPEPSQTWGGWHNPPPFVEIQVTPGSVRQVQVHPSRTGPMVRRMRGVRGNGLITWYIAVKNGDSLPDWHYQIEWIKRQKAQLVPWIDASNPKTSGGWLTALGSWVALLWRNPWLQEGPEVVGRNNVGVIRLQASHQLNQPAAVIQDIFWQPPWQPDHTVYSRYVVPLSVEQDFS